MVLTGISIVPGQQHLNIIVKALIWSNFKTLTFDGYEDCLLI